MIIGATTAWVGGTTATLGLPDFQGLTGQENLRFVTATRLGTY